MKNYCGLYWYRASLNPTLFSASPSQLIEIDSRAADFLDKPPDYGHKFRSVRLSAADPKRKLLQSHTMANNEGEKEWTDIENYYDNQSRLFIQSGRIQAQQSYNGSQNSW